MKAKLLGAAALIAASIIFSGKAQATLITTVYSYAVSGTFYPETQYCIGCSPINLSGTITVSQLTNTFAPGISETDITAVNLIAGDLPAFTTINTFYTVREINHYDILASSPYSEISLQVNTELTSNVLHTNIYAGGIGGLTGPAQITDSYSIGSLGFLRTADGSLDQIAAVPGPIVGSGLPGLLLGLLAWWKLARPSVRQRLAA